MSVKDIKEENDIVIVGSGISGLATALALHRKGIRSVILERADSIRTVGVDIFIYTNGWRALEQLGVASRLRSTAVRLHSKEEIRCLRRRDLVDTLANALPPGTIRFGHHVVAIESEPRTSYPIIQLHNGEIIKPKIIIGCDGVYSIVSKYLGLKPPAFHSVGLCRGFTSYVDGHGFSSEFLQMQKGDIMIGRAPVDEKLVFWFVCTTWHPEDADIAKDPTLMRLYSLKIMQHFPIEMIEMVRQCDHTTLYLAQIRQRALMEVALNRFRKGNVVVAGDAMHVMGPYFGQGGNSALEDAIVLVRCMSREMSVVHHKGIIRAQESPVVNWERVGVAFDKYVKERRPRLVSLGLKSALIGRIIDPSTPFMIRLFCILLTALFFKDVIGPAKYDCGIL